MANSLLLYDTQLVPCCAERPNPNEEAKSKMEERVSVDLKLAYEADSVVRAICDVFASYQRGVCQIMTHTMMADLKA